MNDDGGMAPQEPEVAVHHFADDGSIPSNPTLPLLICKDVLDLVGVDAAAIYIERFAAHRWLSAWRNSIFPFPHYHSAAHEVLGICQGEAKVSLGGEYCLVMTVRSGNALVLPAGTGHQNLGSSPDLLVAGAYPDGMDWDLCCGKPRVREEECRNIQAVLLPENDPLFGCDGPLMSVA